MKRLVVLGSILLTALVWVGGQMAAAQATGESGGFSGILWEDLDENGERSSQEEALAGMIVVLYSIDPPGDDEVDRAVTGLDGRYTFASLPDGRYDVRVEVSSGVAAGTVSGAGVEGRWLSELTTEDWDLGLIRHDPALPPRRDPVPPPQVSVEAITVERPAASAPTSESVTAAPDGAGTDELDESERSGEVALRSAEDLTPSTEQARTTSIPPPPRIDPPIPTTEVPEPRVASATTFVPSEASSPPSTAARVDTTDASAPATSMGTLVPPPATPTSNLDESDAPGRADGTSGPGEIALDSGEGVRSSGGIIDDRATTLVTSAALAMTGIALLTGTRRRRQDLRP